jgi:antagonist of KipI
VPIYTTFAVRAGDVLRCQATLIGARCYLCVHGGIAVPLLLGSASTHLTSGLGGFAGRALRAGDRLASGPKRRDTQVPLRRVRDGVQQELGRRAPLRVTPGPQADWFTAAAQDAWRRSPYRVTEQSDRMGLRLDGTPIAPARTGDMLSEGVSLGAIQVPPDGRPIVSFVEHQTPAVPKIANVTVPICIASPVAPTRREVQSVAVARPRAAGHVRSSFAAQSLEPA